MPDVTADEPTENDLLHLWDIAIPVYAATSAAPITTAPPVRCPSTHPTATIAVRCISDPGHPGDHRHFGTGIGDRQIAWPCSRAERALNYLDAALGDIT